MTRTINQHRNITRNSLISAIFDYSTNSSDAINLKEIPSRFEVEFVKLCWCEVRVEKIATLALEMIYAKTSLTPITLRSSDTRDSTLVPCCPFPFLEVTCPWLGSLPAPGPVLS